MVLDRDADRGSTPGSANLEGKAAHLAYAADVVYALLSGCGLVRKSAKPYQTGSGGKHRTCPSRCLAKACGSWPITNDSQHVAGMVDGICRPSASV